MSGALGCLFLWLYFVIDSNGCWKYLFCLRPQQKGRWSWSEGEGKGDVHFFLRRLHSAVVVASSSLPEL